MSVIVATKDNFESEIVNSAVPVLLDFYADWCGPCRMVSPVVEQIAEENDGIKVAKVNVEEEFELAEAFDVSSIPTLVVMKGGKVTNKSIGYKEKKQILNMLEGEN